MGSDLDRNGEGTRWCEVAGYCRRSVFHEELKTNKKYEAYTMCGRPLLDESLVMPMTYLQETGTRNWYQKTGISFWYVCHEI